jgi:hypothetical protein
LQLAILLHQDFNLAFRRLEFLAAGIRELHTLFEKRDCLLEGQFSLLKFVYDLFQSLETFFKLGQKRNPKAYFSPDKIDVQMNFC